MHTIQNKMEIPFLQVQNELIDDTKHFGKFEKWVWVVLARHGYADAAFPSQKTIADKVGISDRKVRDCLNNLEKNGWLERVGKHDSYGTVKWIVKIPEAVEIEWLKNELERKQSKQPQTTITKNPDPTPETEEDLPYKEIIDHLNEKSGKNYRHNSSVTQKAIRGRWADGYRLKDFMRVIDVKAAEWMGTDMEQYVNPETLLRPANFEKYLNQPQKTDQGKQPVFAAPKQTGAGMSEAERVALLESIR